MTTPPPAADPAAGALLDTLFATAPVGLAWHDADLRFVRINERLAQINGPSVADHIGRRVTDVLPALGADIEHVLRQVLQTGQPVTELPVSGETPAHPGVPRQWRASYFPVRTPDGRVAGVLAEVREVTAPAQARQALDRSEAQFRAMVEASPLGVFLTDPTGQNLYSNHVNLGQMGLTAQEARGSGWLRAMHPDDREEAFARFEAAAREQGPFTASFRYVRPDGTEVPIAVSGSPVRVEGRLLGYVGVVQDVGPQLAAMRALQESEERFRELAANVRDMISEHEPDGRYRYASPACRTLLGYEPEELVGRDPYDFFHPDDAAAVTRAHAQSLTTDLPPQITYRLRRKDGSYTWVETLAQMHRDASGLVTALYCITRDVSERRHLEAALLQAHKMESIGRLAGGVAHDFNNLLTIILSHAETGLQDLPADHPVAEDLRQVRSAAGRAADLTRQLLAFARQQPVKPQVIALDALVADVLRLAHRLVGVGIDVETRLDAPDAMVEADPRQLEQVLLNLVVNARDAMPTGGRVTIATSPAGIEPAEAAEHPGLVAGSYVALRVADTGSGIPADVLPHIFEPFFTTKEPGRGTGLGLATCYGIVKQNRGYIRARNTAPGAVFEVLLPRVAGRRRADPALGYAPGGAAPRAEHPKVVLVAEDEGGVRAIAVRTLERLGYRVLAARDGQQALELAERIGTLDALFTDIAMPRLGGRELARALRERHPDLPVLFTSGHAEEVADPLPGSGHTRFLAKPYLPGNLGDALGELLAPRTA